MKIVDLSRHQKNPRYVAGILTLLSLACGPMALEAQTIGMVVDDFSTMATVFDADTDEILGSVEFDSGGGEGDCSISRDGTLGFVTNFFGVLAVIDIPTLTLAGGINPIQISNPGLDTSLGPDGKFMVVCGLDPPVSSVEIATRSEIDTFSPPGGGQCISVDVCSDGSVLFTTDVGNAVHRLTLDGNGILSDTGESMPLADLGNNVVCSPSGTSGLAITRSSALLQSFTYPGMTPVDSRALSGLPEGLSALINSVGDRAFVQSQGVIDIFSFDQSTAVLGATPLDTISIATVPPTFGTDQVGLHPAGGKLYVSQPGAVDVYDANGNPLTSITDPNNIFEPTGLCFSPLRGPVGPVVPQIPSLDGVGLTILPLLLVSVAGVLMRRRSRR